VTPNKYWSLIKKCNSWTINNSKGLLVSCIVKGLLSIVCLYASLASLGLLLNQIQGKELFNQSLYSSDQQFISLFLIFFISSLAGSFFQYSFYSESFKIWSKHSTYKSKEFLDNIKKLPNKKYRLLNRFYIDHEELMLNSGGRARALGAYGHYSRIGFLEFLKIVFFLIILTIMAPIFTLVVFMCFLVLCPWIITSYKKSTELSLKIETQQKLSGKERISNLDGNNDDTELLFNLITKNFQQSKENSFFTSVATTISIALVFGFAYFQGIQNQDIGYWVLIFIISRLLTNSLISFSSTFVLLSRQAGPANMLESVCNDFSNYENIPAVYLNNDINKNEDNLYCLYQNKVNPSADDLNSILFQIDFFSDYECKPVIISNEEVDRISQELINELSENNSITSELLNCADHFGLSHIQTLVKDLKTKNKNKLKATLVQYYFAKSVIAKKRIFVASNFIWAFKLEKITSSLNPYGAQILFYSSNLEATLSHYNKFIYVYFDSTIKEAVATTSIKRIQTSHKFNKLDDVDFLDG